MSQIKSKDTKPELLVRRFLFANGLRYKLHDSKLPGKPDIVLPRYKSVVFVHGCFWHGHENCNFFAVPKTRTDWWLEKISGNKRRDEIKILQLKKEGWKIFIVFECELKGKKQSQTLRKLLNGLTKISKAIQT